MKTGRFPNFWYWFIITFILVFSFLLRLQNIDRPLLDAHYFRQTQTATVARNFYLSGIDLFHTKLDIFGDGKEQILLLEFPFFQAIVAILSQLLGFHDYVGRFVSLFFGIAGAIILVLIVNKLFSNKNIGLIALVFFIFNPLNFYFHQVYMIESTVIFLHLLSIFLWLKYTEIKRNKWLILASLFTAIAAIHKIVYAPFLLIEILSILYLKLGKQKFKKFRWLPGILFIIFVLLTWQYYTDVTNLANGHSNFTSGDAGQSLWNFGTLNERFDLKRWILKLKFIQNSVTKYQWPVFILGIYFLIRKKNKVKAILFALLLAMVFYYLLLFRIQSHDYYFMLILPVFSIIAAFGLSEVVRIITDNFLVKRKVNNLIIFLIGMYLSLFTYKSVQNARMYFKIDEEMLARLNTYKNVINNPGNILFIFEQYDWNSVFTYYTGHKGIIVAIDNVSVKTIEQYKIKGYKYVIVDGVAVASKMNNTFPDILNKYKRLLSTDNLIILSI